MIKKTLALNASTRTSVVSRLIRVDSGILMKNMKKGKKVTLLFWKQSNQLLLVEIKTTIKFLKSPLMLVNENYRVPDDTEKLFFFTENWSIYLAIALIS